MRRLSSSMFPNRPPLRDLTVIAESIGRAPDLQTALDELVSEMARALDTRACVFARFERGWMIAGQARGGLRVSVSDLQHALNSIPEGQPTAALDLRAIGEGVWTSISLEIAYGPSIAILIGGDWTILDVMLTGFAIMLSFALASVHERESRRRSEHLLVDGYTLARRLSRLENVESVCRRLVEQVGRSVHADRVALALYRPDEDRLAIAATHGYPSSVVKDVRIEPGSWVIGHVFMSGRPVLVPDIRQLKGHGQKRQYRTFSFAAVPMFAGTETLGVLTATDKTDGSSFTRQDILALRTFGVSGALALMAARSDSEVHRLAYAVTVDSLTGLYNRPYLESRLHQEVERAKRGSTSLTLLMADIDDFKAINDTFGHLVGDAVLHGVGGILRSAVRVFDVCARYGGDEFAILMPSSDRSSAAACAERIRQRVEEYSVKDDGYSVPRSTMSIGVAVFEAGDGPSDLIGRADRCLYQAKAEGKNRVRTNSGHDDREPIENGSLERDDFPKIDETA